MTDYNPHSVDATLSRLEAGMKSLGERVDENHADLCVKFDKLSTDVDSLKRSKWIERGFWGCLTAIAGYFGYKLSP